MFIILPELCNLIGFSLPLRFHRIFASVNEYREYVRVFKQLVLTFYIVLFIS